MRFTSVLLLLAVGFLECVDSTSGHSASKTLTDHLTVVTDTQPITLAHRFLRTQGVDAIEDRAGLGKVTDALKAHAKKLTDTLTEILRQKKTAAEVLNSLNLGDDVAGALKNSKLEVLKNYIERLNKKNPDKTISLVGTLSARYGDDEVARAIVSAARRTDSAPHVKELATQLRSQQLRAWLDNGKSVDDVFKLLKLGDDGYEALTSRKLILLDDYIVEFNRANPGHKTTLLKTLTTGFGGESHLVTLLAAAKHDVRTKAKATELENGLLRQWQRENLDPASVMKLLNLDNGVDRVLNNRNLETFEKYIAVFSKKNPENPTTFLGALTMKYEEGEVAKAIVSALKNENMATRRVAAKLQKKQLDGWLERNLAVDDVFKLMKFKTDGSVVNSRNLETLEEYILVYNREKKVSETLIGALAKGFGGEKKLAEMLMRARTYPDSKINAIKVKNAQFRKWRDRGLNPVNVLTKVFSVEEAGASRIQKRIVKEFTTYIERKNAAVHRITDPRRI
ncbi:hypothetical protein L914_07308 [Phytophthora nicotianae]|uniref:RxLR effector protein n=2 Tax=Phytophthora nicotianae TaxID=4792 RepID=W2NJH9_PHYNI|nr:hypothetical protein L914_07308 [Phytophthora nicotianae]